MRWPVTQMTQRPTAARPRWRAHRLACSMLAIDGGVLELEGWRAGWRRAKNDGGGGPERPAKKAMEGSQKIFYFYANRAMLTV